MNSPGRLICPVIFLVTGMLAGTAAPGRAMTEFGARAGYCDLKGEVFRGSGKPGGTPMFGVQAVFSLIPKVNLCLSGEAKSRRLSFNEAPYLGQVFQGQGEWRDLELCAALHAHLIPIGAGPFGLYVGAGGGVHFAEFKLKTPPTIAPEPPLPLPPEGIAGLRGGSSKASGASVGDFVRQVEKKQSDFSWHALVGASVGLPIFPLSAFVEGRFEDVSGDFSPHGYSIYAGLNLSLD